MSSDMKVVQNCAESNTEGSIFIEELFFFGISGQTKHITFENQTSKPITKYP